MYQYSTFSAVQHGLYDGELTVQELKKKGNLGIGTFNALEGELVVLNGDFFHCIQGKIQKASDTSLIAWAAMSDFSHEEQFSLSQKTNYDFLKYYIEEYIGSKNILLAIHLNAEFSNAKICSVPKQKKPYNNIATIINESIEIDTGIVNGDMVGFYAPEYMAHIKSPGFHLHFIDQSRTIGGHVLDFDLLNANISIQKIYNFHLEVPQSIDFSSMNIPIATNHTPQLTDKLHTH